MFEGSGLGHSSMGKGIFVFFFQWSASGSNNDTPGQDPCQGLKEFMTVCAHFLFAFV